MPEADPEAAIVMSNIPPLEDIEMREAEPAPAAAMFQLELEQFGYDPNFAQSMGNMGPGSTSSVTQQEDSLLNSPSQPKAPGAGQPGSSENTGCAITKKKK